MRVSGGSKTSLVGNKIEDNGIGFDVSFTNCTHHHNNFADNHENVDGSSCLVNGMREEKTTTGATLTAQTKTVTE
jgi:hypothetical protein